MSQISLFDGDNKLTIDKKVRLIELFAGYGSQSLALKYLGVPFEHHKICEWAIPSIQAYKDLHATDDNTDYSKELTTEEVFEYLAKQGVSSNYNEPMTYDQIKRLGDEKARTIYNNIKATNNLVSVCNAHGKDFEITDRDKYCYVLTYSFPCQDLSKAGKGKGMAKDSGTRSGLLWEVERILDELNADGGNLPHILLMENVPDVIGTKNISHFADWVKKLDSLGYTSKWQCMNAKNYGVPQNRDRCFMVSWLGDFYYDFPQPFKLKTRLKDVLETNVDEKYYLSSRALEGIKNSPFQSATEEPFVAASRGRNPENPSDRTAGVPTEQRLEPNSQGLCNTLTTVQKDNYVVEPTIMTTGYYTPSKHNASRVIDTNGIAPTVDDNCMGTLRTIDACGCKHIIEPVIYDDYNQRIKADQTCINTLTTNCGNDAERNGVKIIEYISLDEQNKYLRQDGCVGTLTTDGNSPKHNNRIVEYEPNLKQQLCDKLIQNGMVQEYDVIRHSYSTNRLENGEKNMGRVENHEQLSPTLDTRCDCLGVCVKDDSLNSIYTDTEKQLFTEDGNIRRYIGSDKIDEFKEGQMATTSFPNGYGHGPRTHDESITLNCIDKPSVKQNYRIRKLTPKECGRLMGVKDEDIDKMSVNQSNSKLYHLYGDSIVVDVLMGIFGQML